MTSLLLVSVVIVLAAIFFYYIGGTVLYKKKPLIINSKINLIMIAIMFAPQVVKSLGALKHFDKLGILVLLNPLIWVALLVFFWFQMKGYIIFGLEEKSFRKALHESLKKCGYEFEEQLSSLVLTGLGMSVQVSIQDWLGTGQIKMKGKKVDQKILSKIIQEMRSYYKENDVPIKKVTSVFYLIMGTFMVLLSLGLIGFALKLF